MTSPTSGSLEALEEMIKETNKQKDLERDINLLIEQRSAKLSAAIAKQNDLFFAMKQHQTDYEDKAKEIFDVEKELIDLKLKNDPRDREAIKNKEKDLERLKEAKKSYAEIAEKLAEQADEVERLLEVETNRSEMIKRERNLHREIGTLIKNQIGSTIGLSDMFGNLTKGMKLGPALLLQMATNAAELINTVMKGNSEFARTTGQIADRSAAFGYGATQYGIGFEQMNKASATLFTNMANFTNQTRASREELALAAAKMDLFGVSAETSAKNLETMTLGLKMSSAQAIKTTNDLAKAAIGAGIAPSKMLGEFAANMPRLAAYGKQAVGVYIDLQKQAKSLGIELNNLNNIIGDSFDTFENSARAAGRFNAVLGGNYLNSVEMLNATESERIILLKKSFDASGKNFDSLDKYTKKAISATLGINDLNEASKLFGKSTSELTYDMSKQAATQDQLEKSQREAAEVSAQLAGVFNSLLIAVRPLVTAIKWLAEGLAYITDKTYGFGSILSLFLIPNIMRLSGWLFRMPGAVFNWARSMIGLSSATSTAASSTSTSASRIADFIEKIGEAANKNKLALLTLTASFIGLGYGIYLAANGFAAFASSIANLNGEQLTVLAVGMALLTGVFAFFISTMAGLAATGVGELGVALIFAMGLAMLGIGFAIKLAAEGMATFVESLSNFVGTAVQAKDGIAGIGAAITGLFSSMMAFTAFSGPSIAIGFTALTVGITGLSAAINTLPEIKLVAFSSLMQELDSLKDLGAVVSNSLGLISESINKIGQEIDNLPEGKTVKFTNSMDSLNRVLQTSKETREVDIKPTKDLINAAKEYYIAQSNSKEADKDALVNALKQIKQAFGESKNEQQNVPVTLVIDGKTASAMLHYNRKISGMMGGPTPGTSGR